MTTVTARRARSLTGAGLMTAGLLLLLTALVYFIYGTYSRARLDQLVVQPAQSAPSLETLQQDLAPSGSEVPPGPVPAAEMAPGQDPVPPAPNVEVEEPSVAPGALFSEPAGIGFDFTNLRSQASSSATGSSLGSQFQRVDWATLPTTVEKLPAATRILIPAIGVDSRIQELYTRWDGEGYVWDTPAFAVGHHDGTPNPGEKGNAVLSGHISSPIRGEGAVFKRLPEVAMLLKEGRTVDIVLEAGDKRYLYRAVSTDVKEPIGVQIFRTTDIPSLTLVTCVPDWTYSHRFLVNAVLVGVAPKG